MPLPGAAAALSLAFPTESQSASVDATAQQHHQLSQGVLCGVAVRAPLSRRSIHPFGSAPPPAKDRTL